MRQSFFMSRFLSVVNQFKRYSADNAHHDGNRDCDDNDQRVPLYVCQPDEVSRKRHCQPQRHQRRAAESHAQVDPIERITQYAQRSHSRQSHCDC